MLKKEAKEKSWNAIFRNIILEIKYQIPKLAIILMKIISQTYNFGQNLVKDFF